MKILFELNEVYRAGYTNHPLFWRELDNLDLTETWRFAKLLSETRLVTGGDWAQLCSFLDSHRRTPGWRLTGKQARWLKILVVKHYRELEVLLELA